LATWSLKFQISDFRLAIEIWLPIMITNLKSEI